MIYVDQIKVWPTGIRCFRNGSCHLFADTLEELHAMAVKLGLKRAWYQYREPIPHYDLTIERRIKAIELGVASLTTKLCIKRWMTFNSK